MIYTVIYNYYDYYCYYYCRVGDLLYDYTMIYVRIGFICIHTYISMMLLIIHEIQIFYTIQSVLSNIRRVPIQ